MVQRIKDIAAGEEELLHGQHNLRRAAGDGACTGMHPAHFAVVSFGDCFELQFIGLGGVQHRNDEQGRSQQTNHAHSTHRSCRVLRLLRVPQELHGENAEPRDEACHRHSEIKGLRFIDEAAKELVHGG